jgi:purine-binding chemotaxis protein CheW
MSAMSKELVASGDLLGESGGFLREDSIEMCSVRVGETLFGVAITRILEILGAPQTLPVPLAPVYVGGLVHYRGEVLTAVSLRRLLAMPPLAASSDILVCEGPGGYFGLLVDAVGEVMTVSPLDFEPNPSTLDDHRKSLFSGTCKLKDGLLVLLDPDRLDPTQLAH